LDELKPAFELIGDVLDTFVTITDELQPVNTKFDDNVVITSSFSSVSHFEHDIKDVLRIYKNITGKDLNLDEDIKESK